MGKTNKQILIDAHTHTSGISLCSRVCAEEMINVCIKDEVDILCEVTDMESIDDQDGFDKSL